MPGEQREAIEQADEIFGFMRQSHISGRNVARPKCLADSPDREIAGLAAIVLEVAEIKPCRRRRLKILAQKRPDLLRRARDSGLDPAHYG
jgi:hypothetical protein